MKITFVSNFMNHHQMPLCESLLAISDVNFTFIATEAVPDDRIQLGYSVKFSHLPYYREAITDQDFAEAEELCFNSDVLIFGSAPMKFVKRRLRAEKLTFSYNERFFKRGFWNHPGDIYRAIRDYTRFNNPNFYQLCASAYTACDSNCIFAFPERKFRWGYFPVVKEQNVPALLEGKEQGSLLWVGRFLDWKHPEKAVEVARRLKEEGIAFRLSMIGVGEMEEQIKALIKRNGLQKQVNLLGSMTPEEVRLHMEQSQVFLFTSDRNEGWGAVLNEAMNSGCAVVASEEIGAVPYLIQPGRNGTIYKNNDDEQLYQQVKRFLLDQNLAERLGTEAYQTMVSFWNGGIAAQRLYAFCKAKLAGTVEPVYLDGPMSWDCEK
ncbi:MAG: glycosyltransferase [Oscillospiraceae bacterium]|nr:glycosyltransferase [Oscillospiraceae bacterium]